MTEVKGDLWTWSPGERKVVRCITTNGATRKDGSAVMGRGCARQAATRFRGIQQQLGRWLKDKGNVPCSFISQHGVLTFPVKHHWAEDADPMLIKTSAKFLKGYADLFPQTVFLLPRPGTGNGKLNWEDVKPLLTFLPDNVVVISLEGE